MGGNGGAITYVGATPVFADITKDTLCVSADSIARCITSRTKAIVTVDLYGGVPDMAAVNSVANGLPVIEDAAQAIGAKLDGRPAGTLGDIGAFSFFTGPTMTTGEGGMVVTDDRAIFERISRLRDHGRTADGFKLFVTDEVAFKYRMSSLQAAFGRAELTRIDELVDKKRQIFDWYRPTGWERFPVCNSTISRRGRQTPSGWRPSCWTPRTACPPGSSMDCPIGKGWTRGRSCLR